MEKKQWGMLALAGVAVLTLFWTYASSNAIRSRKPSVFVPSNSPSTASLKVQVAGCVMKPGVYVLPANSRVQDALKKAGGPTPDADTSALNLAGWLQDGAKIDVPAHVTVAVAPTVAAPPAVTSPAMTAVPNTAPNAVPTAVPSPEIITNGFWTPSPNATPSATTSPSTQENAAMQDFLRKNPVNLNTANAAQLAWLPEIGPKIAQRILDDRAVNGSFRSVDDLSRIKGVKAKTIAAIQPFVVVN